MSDKTHSNDITYMKIYIYNDKSSKKSYIILIFGYKYNFNKRVYLFFIQNMSSKSYKNRNKIVHHSMSYNNKKT